MPTPGPVEIIVIVGIVAALLYAIRPKKYPTTSIPTKGPAVWGGQVNPLVAPQTGDTITRTYRGKPDVASGLFAQDAAGLAQQGYRPTSQIYTPGSWGVGAFLIALLLALVLIGILIFIYLIVVKPDGTLVVTYERTSAEKGITSTSAPSDPAGALDSLARMLDAGHISPEEYEAKKAELLARL